MRTLRSRGRRRSCLAIGLLLLGWAPVVQAATYTWIGTGNTPENPWTDPNQWDPIGPHNFLDTGDTPGDDLIFGLSAVTTVNMRPTTSGAGNAEDRVNSLLFTAGAPAYTFVSADPQHDIDLFGPMTNNSGVVQTFLSGIAFDTAACIVNGTTGDLATNYAFECGDHLWTGGGPTYNGPFDVHVAGTGTNAMQAINVIINDAKIVVEGGTTSAGTYTVDGNGTLILNGPWAPSSSATAVTKQGTGTLVLNAASDVTARPWTISRGIVRISDGLAMGNNTRSISLPGNRTGFGTLQLTNNITLTKNISLSARQVEDATVPAIENLSGNNTYSGNITIGTGGNQYNLSALDGKLTIASTWAIGSNAGGMRITTVRGPGEIEFAGTFGGNNANEGSCAPLVHYGNGTVTLSGANNYRVGHIISMGGGTIKFGSAFGNTESDQVSYPLFAPSDDQIPPNPIHLQVMNDSVLDFSAMTATGGSNIGLPTGGLLLNRPLAGTGTVIGHVKTDVANAIIRPGGVMIFDPDGYTPKSFATGPGTLTLQNDLDLSAGGAKLQYNLSNQPNGANSKLVVNGALTEGPNTIIEVTQSKGALGSGTYRLIDYTGPALNTASFALQGVTLTPRQPSAELQSVANQLNLVVVGDPATLTWVGGENANAWDYGTTVNWTGAIGAPPDNRFYDGDNVIFSDTGSTEPPVNVVGTVSPASFSFTHSSGHDYAFSGGNIAANLVTTSGSGNVTFGNTDLSTEAMALNSSGALTLANTGALTLPAAVALNAGTMILNRADAELTVSSAISGAGTLKKEGAAETTLILNGNNASFNGEMIVSGGTLRTDGTTALGTGGSTAAGVTVLDGATLDVFNNGPNAPQGGTEVVTITGVGVNGIGALTSTQQSSASSAHVNGIILAGNARISAHGSGGTTAGRSILWVDGPDAFIQGNGFDLEVLIDNQANSGNGTEVDWMNVGETNLANVTLSGGGSLYLGGSTTLGQAAGVVKLDDGRLGFYGSLDGAASTAVIDKPILVDGNGGGIDVYNGDKTIDSTVTLNGDLEIVTYSRANNTTATATFTGALTGTGLLGVHLNANGTTSRRGMVELVSSSNDYTGSTTIGGGSDFASAANDRITLSIGNGGTTGSVGPGDVILNAKGTLRFNRNDTYAFPNAVTGDGDAEFFAGKVYITGTHAGAGTYTVAAADIDNNIAGGTLAGAGSIGATVVVESAVEPNTLAGTLAPGGLTPGKLTVGNLSLGDYTNLVFRLDSPANTADDEVLVNGTLDLSAVTTLNVTVSSLTDPALAVGNYLLVGASAIVPPAGSLAVNLTGPTSVPEVSLQVSGTSLFLVVGTPPPPTLQPDIEPDGGDGDVDMADLNVLLGCMGPPEVPVAPGCATRDFDQDNDIDQSDFAIWQACFSGPGVQADRPLCTGVQVP